MKTSDEGNKIIVPAEAVKYIEDKGDNLFKFEVIEGFFEWLKLQPKAKAKALVKELLENA